MENLAEQTILEELQIVIANGGFVMPPLVILAALLWLGIGFRIVTLKRGTKVGVRALVNAAWDGSLQETNGYVDTAARMGARIAHQHPPHLRRALDEDLFEITESLSTYRTLIRTIVLIAPLAGLLGTVTGMIEMFDSLGSQTFYSQTGGVANGISQALLTTQMGLMVAVPGMIVGRLMDRREDSMQDEIEQIKEMLVARYSANATEDSA